MRIAIDAMGGDHAPRATVEGAIAAARELGVAILLVGDRAALELELARQPTAGLDVEVRHAPDAIGMDEPPTGALKRSESSLYRSFVACRDGEAAGVVFAGNTGAGMVLGAHVMGRLPGVERPAIAALLPSQRGRTVLLDAGANVDCRPFHLAQFAVMGDAYARAERGIAAPRIGLLSNGLEDSKGNELTRAAAPLVRQLPINFVGYVEGGEISSGAADVVVCDGFVGNVVLKSLEGLGRLINGRMRETFAADRRSKLAYLLVRRRLGGLRNDLDSREAGGALLVGLNGIAVKAHGSSDARAVHSAIAMTARLAERDVARLIADGIAAMVLADAASEPRRARRLWQSIKGRIAAHGRSRPVAEEHASVERGESTAAEVATPPPPAPAAQNGAQPAAKPEPTTYQYQGYAPNPGEPAAPDSAENPKAK